MTRGRQLSPRQCGQIQALQECGLSQRQVAERVGISRGAVANCLKRLVAGNNNYGMRPGRPRKTSARADRFLEVTAMRNRRSTSRQFKQDPQESTGQAVSRSLICRRLLERGTSARRPRKKPRLTPRHRRLRREWAAVHRARTLDDWKTVLFSDESKISLGNDGCLYVWRRQGEELAPECCLQTVKHAASAMVWGSGWKSAQDLRPIEPCRVPGHPCRQDA